MSNSVKDDLESIASKVNLTLLDPLGKSIAGLKYQIKHGAEVIAEGVTDGQGKIAAFTSEVGKELAVHVERFTTGEMKQIKTVIPWAEQFAVKLLSGKVKHQVELKKDAGAPGAYKRKTHTIQKGDTLGKIAAKNSVSVEALAALNGLKLTDTIFPGMTLKIPPEKGVPAAAPKSAPATTAQATATPPAQASSPAHADATTSNYPVGPVANAPVFAPPTKTPPRPIDPPLQTKKEEGRGDSGTPKTTINLQCDKSACIKIGDKGPLIEELNIRLTGFGSTPLKGAGYDEFTSKTEEAVKQFQRDYMNIAETGKVCGAFIKALDDFSQKYPALVESMSCTHCRAFGKREAVSYMHLTGAVKGHENPGMHRALVWIFKASQFYMTKKESGLGYKFDRVSSGYRCTIKAKELANGAPFTTNHMGNALDLLYTKGGAKTNLSQTNEIREQVFMKHMHAEMNWKKVNVISLEPGSAPPKKAKAPTWVHLDIREFEPIFLQERYYVTTSAAADGQSMVALALNDKRTNLANCGGIAQKAPPAATGRTDVKDLEPSKKIISFIQDYEEGGHFSPKPYNCPKKFCTIGWGHLIDGEKSCEALAARNSPKYAKYVKGIDKKTADEILANDVEIAAKRIRKIISVPLFQHEFDALVSLSFNCGNKIMNFEKLITAANTKNYSACCHEFHDITNGNLPGLVKRRRAEMDIFSRNIYNSKH